MRGKIIDITALCYDAEAERRENYIGRRIAELRKERGMSLADLGNELARRGVYVSPSAVNKWEKGGSAPNAYQLLAIAETLGVADLASCFMGKAEAQLNGEGLRKLAEYRADLVASGRYVPRKPAAIEYIDMPVSSLRVSAGTGAFLDEDNFEMVSFPAATVPGGADFGVRVSGDSMEPVYHDGQIVWIRRCESLAVGEVGVFICDGDGYLKVYGEQEPEEMWRDEFLDSYGRVRPQPVLISYNKAYEPREVSPCSLFQIVGRVL